MHPLPHQYRMTLQYNGGLAGALNSTDQAAIPFAAPVEFDGPGTGWSPETLLLSSVSGCIALTFAAICKMMKVEFSHLEISATGIVENIPGDKRMHFSRIELQPALQLTNPADEGKLPKIWENTEKHCLVSNSLKTPVHIQPPQLKS